MVHPCASSVVPRRRCPCQRLIPQPAHISYVALCIQCQPVNLNGPETEGAHNKINYARPNKRPSRCSNTDRA